MRAIVVMPLAEQRGGAEVMLKQLAHSQSQIEWHIVFLEDGPMVSDCRARGTKTYVVGAGRLRHPLRYIQTIRRLANLVQHVKAEAILSWMEEWLPGLRTYRPCGTSSACRQTSIGWTV
jgi:hypothetical protein